MLAEGFFHQTFEPHDLVIVGLLVVLEGVLSVDNALVLGLLARRLPRRMQGRALTYGLVGAFVFRAIAIGTAQFLLKWSIVKLLGGGYLVYVAVKHFLSRKVSPEEQAPEALAAVGKGPAGAVEASPSTGNATAPRSSRLRETESIRRLFWSTVVVIEITDIAFAIDSILAAIALVGAAPADHPEEAFHPKLWVVVTGGMLGVILMRFAAVIFIRLLERFPRFETAAYLLVLIIGLKLVVDFAFNSEKHPHRVNFHDLHSPAFWAFWTAMLVCFAIGFLPKRNKPAPASAA